MQRCINEMPFSIHRKLTESEKKMRRGKEDKGSCLVKRGGLSGSVTITLNVTEKEREREEGKGKSRASDAIRIEPIR